MARQTDPGAEEALARYSARCSESLAFWLSHECMLKASPFAGLGLGAQVRCPPNRPQRRHCDLIDRQKRDGGIVKGISLKTRKHGGTFLLDGALTREMVLVPGTSALIMAHTTLTAKEIATMSDLILRHLDVTRNLAKLDHRTTKRLSNGSRVDVQTAGTKEPPSFGFAFDVAVLSEFAHYPDPAKVWTAVRNAAIAARFFWVESQANGRGGLFYDMWTNEAQTEEEWFRTPPQERRLCKFFVPYFECEWYTAKVADDDAARYVALLGEQRFDRMRREGLLLDDEEESLAQRFMLGLGQIVWRRWAIRELCGGDPATFREQYPVDEETAFLAGGRPIFTLDVLEARQKGIRDPISRGCVRDGAYREGEGTCDVWIFEDPDEDASYIMGADAAQGDPGGEPSAMEIVRRDPKRQVAEFVGTARPRVLADLCDAMGRLYGGATAVSERDGINFAFLEPLHYELDYPDVYRDVDEEDVKTGGAAPRIGIKVSARRRETLTDLGRSAVADLSFAIPSSRLVNQVCALVFDSMGRIKHSRLGNDDAYRAFCNANYAMVKSGAPESRKPQAAPKKKHKPWDIDHDDPYGTPEDGPERDDVLGTCF